MDRKINKEELSDLIENLHSQWEQAEEKDKSFLAGQVEKYARHYHDITGEWYVRDPAKNLYSKRANRIVARIDVGI
jgi:hypothetical protein